MAFVFVPQVVPQEADLAETESAGSVKVSVATVSVDGDHCCICELDNCCEGFYRMNHRAWSFYFACFSICTSFDLSNERL